MIITTIPISILRILELKVLLAKSHRISNIKVDIAFNLGTVSVFGAGFFFTMGDFLAFLGVSFVVFPFFASVFEAAGGAFFLGEAGASPFFLAAASACPAEVPVPVAVEAEA